VFPFTGVFQFQTEVLHEKKVTLLYGKKRGKEHRKGKRKMHHQNRGGKLNKGGGNWGNQKQSYLPKLKCYPNNLSHSKEVGKGGCLDIGGVLIKQD